MQEKTCSITAKLCAYNRGLYADSIFNDYLAHELLGKSALAQMRELVVANDEKLLLEDLGSVLLSRGAWAEGHLKCFAQGRPQVQYLIMGASLDTFAWRNRNPNVRVFEVDHPDTQREKRSRLSSLRWSTRGTVTFTEVDFTKDSLSARLLESGFKPFAPTFITVLGVAYYLPFSAFENTIAELSALISGPSRLLFDFPVAGFKDKSKGRALADLTGMLGEHMTDGYLISEVEAMLFEHGWGFSEHLTPEHINRRFFAGSGAMKAFDGIHLMQASRTNRTI